MQNEKHLLSWKNNLIYPRNLKIGTTFYISYIIDEMKKRNYIMKRVKQILAKIKGNKVGQEI